MGRPTSSEIVDQRAVCENCGRPSFDTMGGGKGDVGGGSDRDRDASLNSDRADLGMIGGGESLRGPPPPSATWSRN